LAIPLISNHLLVSLENASYLPASAPPPAAIVILSGDIHRIKGEPGIEIGSLTLERLRAGAAVYRTTHLPVLTSGGSFNPGSTPIADLMAKSLIEDFGVPTHWIESNSRTTWENAERSAAILKSEGIHSIFLVTHSWHMRRAVIAFSQFGISVTPAPTALDEHPGLRPADFIPSVSAWQRSYYALHEWIGCGWYALLAHWSSQIPTIGTD
jgi:uncharacterized SAM-binding protein YcdF (DUF218 family)